MTVKSVPEVVDVPNPTTYEMIQSIRAVIVAYQQTLHARAAEYTEVAERFEREAEHWRKLQAQAADDLTAISALYATVQQGEH